MLADTAAALGGRERVACREDPRPRRRRHPLEPGSGHDDGGHRPDVCASPATGVRWTSAADACACSRRARRTSCTSRDRRRRRRSSALDGEVAYTVAASGTASRAGAQAARDRDRRVPSPSAGARPGGARRQGRCHQPPHGGRRAARRHHASRGRRGPSRWPSMPPATCPRASDRRRRTRTWATSSSRRDSRSTSDESGLKLPRRLETQTDRFKTAELRLARATVDGDAGEVAAPEAARTAAAPAPAAPSVVAEVVAPGVWLLGGQSHHSALIEFGDHLLLVEAPQSEARTLAAIAKARELVPGKPLTQLVTLPPPLRSHRRAAGGDRRGTDGHHAAGQRRLLRGGREAALHASARRAGQGRLAPPRSKASTTSA